MTSAPLLLVEDDPDIQENLREFLELEGFEVRSARNGREALIHLNAGHPVSVILLDLMMPIMNGYEFLDALKSNPPAHRAPVVVLSAAPDLARLAGEQDLFFVKKPIDLDQLLAAIARSSNGVKS